VRPVVVVVVLEVVEGGLAIDAVKALFRKNGLPLPSPSRERGF